MQKYSEYIHYSLYNKDTNEKYEEFYKLLIV